MNNKLIDTVLATIEQRALLPHGTTVILGLSGGSDSTFLLHTLAHMQRTGIIKVIAAHLDHGWRPDSAKDVAFCAEQAAAVGVPFVSAHLSDLGLVDTYNGSQEEWGRKARRTFFERLCQEHGAQRIALAHHADDQEETFFIRLLRGTSLTGLTGMKWHDRGYIRPLLGTRKADIIAYLDEHSVSYLVDPTNNSPIYLRNRIRHTVVPALKAVDQRFSVTFARSQEQLQEVEDFLAQITVRTFNEISGVDAFGTLLIDNKKFLSLHRVLQERILVHWFITQQLRFTPSQALWHEVIRFMENAGSNRHAVHTTWSLVKKSPNFVTVSRC